MEVKFPSLCSSSGLSVLVTHGTFLKMVFQKQSEKCRQGKKEGEMVVVRERERDPICLSQ